MSGCDAFLSPQLSRQDRGRGKARQGKARALIGFGRNSSNAFCFIEAHSVCGDRTEARFPTYTKNEVTHFILLF